MCTVSFIPGKTGIIITSNRDEKVQRKPALPPQLVQMANATLLFPRDGDAGGSWIALNDNGNAAVLLNGAFINHVPQPPYARSRGLVFLDIVAAFSPHKYFLRISLDQIEPFTIVLYEQKNLFECRWDGIHKQVIQLPVYHTHIWSSVTLYDAESIRKREQWFEEFLRKKSEPNFNEVIDFHLFGGEGDSNNDLHMNRSDAYLTVSITGMQLSRNSGKMLYKDLVNGIDYTNELPFASQLIAS